MSSKIFIKVESSLEQQENLRNSRKSLKVLQRTSTDKENLVGRQAFGPQKAFVKSKSENDFNDTSDIKRKKLANNQAPSSQVATATVTATATAAAAVKSRRSSELQRITEEDVQGTGELSAGYWRELAEKRRLALDASLTENQELHEINASLKEQLDVSNQMLDESRNLVEILSEMLEEGETTGPAGSGFERGESSKSFLHASIAEEAAEVEGIGMVEDSDEATPKGDFDADDEDSRDGVMRTTMRTTAEATTTTDDDDDDVDDKATNAAD